MNDFFAQLFGTASQFHFLRPDWFYLIIPLTLLWYVKGAIASNTQWHQVIPPHLAKVLLNNKQQKIKRNTWLIPFIWLLAVTALAGPTWQKIEKPVFQVKRASVLLLDMSMSMRATDVKPNRLAKARFKAIDLAKAINDGEIALVAYAGDAFTISPLTPDNRNITALIPSLSPEIMPEAGSYPLAGISKAAELLEQAGFLSGDIYWLTDGIEREDVDGLNQFISNTPYKINIMTFGTSSGAPIKMLDNSLLKDAYGSIVIPKLNAQQLAQFANASGGVFVNSTPTDIDIKTLVSGNHGQSKQLQENDDKDQSLTGDDWQEFGPYLVLIILPIVLLAFRKGVVLSLILAMPLLTSSPSVIAQQQPVEAVEAIDSVKQEKPIPRHWSDFAFNTKDQVAKQDFQNGDYQQAQQTFEDLQWKGASAYKAGDFETALQHFQQDKSTSGLYNQGNALAQLNKLDEAIEAYKQVLKQDPNHQQAIANKTLLEQMKQQQEQQDQEKQQQDSEQQDQQGGQQQDQQKSDNEEQSDSSNQSQNSEQNSEQNTDQQSQQNDQKNEQSQPSDPSSDPAQEKSQEQSQQQQGEQSDEQGEQENQQAQQSNEQGEEGQQSQSGQLTNEQVADQENQQKLQQLLRKVSDDPSVLLRNKMILESRKRQQTNRAPKGAKKSW